MRKKFLLKSKSADIFSLIIRIVLIAFAVYLAYIAFIVIREFNESEEREKEAIGYFGEVYEYVKENEDIFMQFSEYKYSLSKGREIVIPIERNGNMQDKRDIIFKYFYSGSVYYDDKGNANVMYDGFYGSSYEITLYITKNAAKDKYENEMMKIVNDDMYIHMLRVRF